MLAASSIGRQQRAQLGHHERRPLEDVAAGAAPELVAAGARLALATAVLLPGVAGVVVAIAVELDGQRASGNRSCGRL